MEYKPHTLQLHFPRAARNGALPKSRRAGVGGTAGTAGTGGRTDGRTAAPGGHARSARLDMNTTPLIFPRPVGRSGPGLPRPTDPGVSQRRNRPQHRQRGRDGAAGPHPRDQPLARRAPPAPQPPAASAAPRAVTAPPRGPGQEPAAPAPPARKPPGPAPRCSSNAGLTGPERRRDAPCPDPGAGPAEEAPGPATHRPHRSPRRAGRAV